MTQTTINTRLTEIKQLLDRDHLSFELRQILVQDQMRLLYQRDVLNEK